MKVCCRLISVLSVLVLFATTAWAGAGDAATEIDQLKRRVNALEAQQNTTDQTESSLSDSLRQINQYVSLNGLFEVEASYANEDGGDDESDITVATAQLGLEATLNDYLGGHLILLYEETEGEEDDIDVDEAVIHLTSSTTLFDQTPSLHLGRMYLPFGAFNSSMVSDPLTLDLGETQDSAALVALEGEQWNLHLAVFNGDADSDDDNHIDSFVAAVDVALCEQAHLGASYISDLAESDIELVQDDSLYSDDVAAASIHLSLAHGDFGFAAEYLTALDDFDAVVIEAGEDLTGKRPQAWFAELTWAPCEKSLLATRYEEADDFQDDVTRYGATASYLLHEYVALSLEYQRSEANEEDSDLVTAQMALAF